MREKKKKKGRRKKKLWPWTPKKNEENLRQGRKKDWNGQLEEYQDKIKD